MFKKDRDLAERSRTLLKNKEVRNFKADLIKNFQGISETDLNAVIPNKADLTLVKLANRTLLYSLDNIVLAFDVGGRGNLYPSLAFLWKFPDALPAFVIHSPVSEFILRGADLMIPGVATLSGLEHLREGSKVAIKVRNNPLPFAIGESTVDYDTLAVRGQRKGKAMTVLHLYGDFITPARSVPNSGFGSSRIHGLDSTDDCARDDDTEEEEEEDGEDENSCTAESDTQQQHSAGSVDSAVDQAELLESTEKLNIETALSDQAFETPSIIDNSIAEVKTEQSQAEIRQLHDANLKRALMLALKYIVKDKDLPMLVSTFWALIQRCAHEDGVVPLLEVKKSSFKKVSTFLADCDRKQGLLTVKEENGVSTLLRINKTHDWFIGVKPVSCNAEEFKAAVASAATSGCDQPAVVSAESDFAAIATAAAAPGTSKSAGMMNSSKIVIVELYKLTKHLRDIFGNARGQFGDTLKASEIRELVTKYIKGANLEDTSDRARVLIPGFDPLYSLLWKTLSAANEEIKCEDGTVPMTSTRTNKSSIRDPSSVEQSSKKAGIVANGIKWDDSVVGGEGDDDDCSEEGFINEAPTLPSSLQTKALDLLPGGQKEIKLKIRDGGLLSVEEVDAPQQKPQLQQQPQTAAYMDANFPTLATSQSNSSNQIGHAHSSSVWKPVTLSTKRAQENKAAAAVAAAPGTRKKALQGKPSATAATAATAHSAVSDPNKDAQPQQLTEGCLSVRKDEFYKAVLDKASPYFAVLSSDGSYLLHSGQLPKVKIIVESRMGNKTVTLLRGLEVFNIDAQSFAKQSQKRFACSVSLSSVPGIPKEKEIILQGNFAHEAESYLVETFGIPQHLVSMTSAKGAKLKKKK